MTATNTFHCLRLTFSGLVLAMLVMVSEALAQDDEPFVVKRAAFKLDESMLILQLET